MRRKLVRVLAASSIGGAVIGAAFSWVALRAPMRWPVRVLGLESVASVRVRWGLASAQLLGRRAVVLLGDSRFEQLGAEGIGGGEELVVPAGIAGATARAWRAALHDVPSGTRPGTFVVWLGVNDLVNEGSSAANVGLDLHAIVDRLCSSSDRVLLLEQIPVRLPASAEATRVAAASLEINRELQAIAKRSSCIEIVPLWTLFAACTDCYADALHLSEHGNRMLRELLTRTLRARS